MKKDELYGRWTHTRIQYVPREYYFDDDDIDTSGAPLTFYAGAVLSEDSFLRIDEDGTFVGRYWNEITGKWRVRGQTAQLDIDGEWKEVSLEHGVLVMTDYDEEHDQDVYVHFERAAPA